MRGQKLFQAHSWLPQAGHVHMCRSAWAPRVCPACSWTGGLHFLCSSLRNPSSSFSYAWTVICKTEPQIKISLCYKIINHGIKYIFQILNSCLGGYHNYYSDGGVMITIGIRYCPWHIVLLCLPKKSWHFPWFHNPEKILVQQRSPNILTQTICEACRFPFLQIRKSLNTRSNLFKFLSIFWYLSSIFGTIRQFWCKAIPFMMSYFFAKQCFAMAWITLKAQT